MDFLTTARLLMDLQAKHPDLRYDFKVNPITTEVNIRFVVDDNVPDLFESAYKMFEPVS